MTSLVSQNFCPNCLIFSCLVCFFLSCIAHCLSCSLALLFSSHLSLFSFMKLVVHLRSDYLYCYFLCLSICSLCFASFVLFSFLYCSFLAFYLSCIILSCSLLAFCSRNIFPTFLAFSPSFRISFNLFMLFVCISLFSYLSNFHMSFFIACNSRGLFFFFSLISDFYVPVFYSYCIFVLGVLIFKYFLTLNLMLICSR